MTDDAHDQIEDDSERSMWASPKIFPREFLQSPKKEKIFGSIQEIFVP